MTHCTCPKGDFSKVILLLYLVLQKQRVKVSPSVSLSLKGRPGEPADLKAGASGLPCGKGAQGLGLPSARFLGRKLAPIWDAAAVAEN